MSELDRPPNDDSEFDFELAASYVRRTIAERPAAALATALAAGLAIGWVLKR
ncbi:hypothetical protein [Pseudobythopirellula maris]|nr:hypothetical protein [Pseudobythopirellula maris]